SKRDWSSDVCSSDVVRSGHLCSPHCVTKKYPILWQVFLQGFLMTNPVHQANGQRIIIKNWQHVLNHLFQLHTLGEKENNIKVQFMRYRLLSIYRNIYRYFFAIEVCPEATLFEGGNPFIPTINNCDIITSLF